MHVKQFLAVCCLLMEHQEWLTHQGVVKPCKPMFIKNNMLFFARQRKIPRYRGKERKEEKKWILIDDEYIYSILHIIKQ